MSQDIVHRCLGTSLTFWVIASVVAGEQRIELGMQLGPVGAPSTCECYSVPRALRRRGHQERAALRLVARGGGRLGLHDEVDLLQRQTSQFPLRKGPTLLE
jgi:hypothetical protein